MIDKIAIIGAGYLGKGIARAVAAQRIEVYLKDVDEETVREAIGQIAENIDFEIERWALTKSEKNAIMDRIHILREPDDLAGIPLVIEAVPEDLQVKKGVFAAIDQLFPPETIFATNTSVLSITELGAATRRPDKVIGFHFLHPPHKHDVVEVVKGLRTSPETVQAIIAFAQQIGKTPIEVFENPGYVTSRLILAFIAEAIMIAMEGVASPVNIDKAMRLGFGFHMGPLELADRIGLDEVEKRLKYLADELGDNRFRPHVLLRKMVHAGDLGVKTGRGFFTYNEDGKRLDNDD
ncbi:MAG: 3-hydroxybutyryl-CoA dehydrogenase [Candidatus Sumerlaeia bacterium]